jgi:hypothetical protein
MISDYSGPLCRIRDTFDDSEHDVGQDANGDLDVASISVTGSAAVTTIYNQVDPDDNLVQSTSSRQPILQWGSTSTVSGRPQAKPDGSDDFMRAEKLSTDPSAPLYLVGRPLIFIRGSGFGTGGDIGGCLAGIPNQDGAHTSPFYRWAFIRNSADTNQMRAWIAGTATQFNSSLRYGRSTSALCWMPYEGGRILEVTNTGQYEWSTGQTNPVTYPNATRLYIFSRGDGDENGTMAFEEMAILDGEDKAISAAGSVLWGMNRFSSYVPLRALFDRNVMVEPGDIALDVPFSTALGFGDNSGRDSQVRSIGPAAPSADYVEFDGTDDYVVIDQDNGWSPPGDFTLEVDLWFNSFGSNERIIWCHGGGNGGQRGWILSIHDANIDELMFIAGTQSNARNYVVTGEHGSQANLVTGQWYSVKVTRVGSTIQIFVDGVSRASRSVSSNIHNSEPMYLGCEKANTLTNFFHGRIRNLKLTWD